MYKYISLLFIFILIKMNAQINKQLIDNWTRVKSSMLDGSRDLSENDQRILTWKITDNKLCEYMHPIFEDMKTCMDIKIEGQSIKASALAFYEIEKLTSDSLVVISRINGETSADKIKKIWFVRTSKFRNEYLSKIKSDSTITASRYFTPTLKKNIFPDIFDRYPNDFLISGNIIIYPKKHAVNIQHENTNQSKKSLESIEFLKSTLEKSYHLWNLEGFENFDQVSIPFNIENKTKYMGSFQGATMSFSFFRSELKSSNKIPVKIENKLLSNETFLKGIKAVDDKKLDKAIELFNKAFELNNTNTDALYNIVSISLSKNDVTTACTALKKLKDFEQTEGTKIFNEKCLKH
ncbi:hypothetical protein [Chryseobacterium oranimense]|uniref:tetratricopeptide repeat protein n=1 Tax=Chryseobacterium oranimense TaxID=421058 RepID=UPI0031DB08A4